MNLDDFKLGDRLIITSRTRHGSERRVAYVSAVNYKGNGLVTFEGRGLEPGPRGGFLYPAGQGAFDPVKVGMKPYGLVTAVEKVGR